MGKDGRPFGNKIQHFADRTVLAAGPGGVAGAWVIFPDTTPEVYMDLEALDRYSCYLRTGAGTGAVDVDIQFNDIPGINQLERVGIKPKP